MEKPPVTEKRIERLREFIDSVTNEFMNARPELKGMYHHLIGLRIQQVQSGELNEREYIDKWMERI